MSVSCFEARLWVCGEGVWNSILSLNVRLVDVKGRVFLL